MMLRGLVFAFTLGLTSMAYGQMFVIEFVPAKNWTPERSYENQPGIKPHLDYWQQWYVKEVLLMSGPFADQSGGIFLIKAKNRAMAEQMVADDPAVKSQLIDATVRRWRLLSSAMRRVKPMIIELEPDQSFKVQSADPGAPINLPGN
ncbi:MAG: YciI family protein [Pseudomonadales bacterium]|jgi:uncharacterized protein YciI